MSEIYNSELIRKLYNETRENQLAKIANEIGDIANPVFIYPLIDAYKKNLNTFIPHYFLGALKRIEHPDTLKAILPLLEDSYSVNKNLTWLLPILQQHNYFEDSVIEKTVTWLDKFKGESIEDLHSFDLAGIISYLQSAKKLELIEGKLYEILFTDDYDKEVQAAALKGLLKMNASKTISILIDSYEERVKQKDAEIVLAEELRTWKNGRIPELKDLIKNHGHHRAKEILIEHENKIQQQDQREEQQQAQKDSVAFGNTRVVKDIYDERKTINTLTGIHFNLALLENSEALIQQVQSATNRDEMRARCIELRDIFKSINEKVKDHGLSIEEVKKELPDVAASDLNKPINQFYLWLISKKLGIDAGVFGLRKLNRIVSLFAHPDDEPDLINELRNKNLLEYYVKNQWPELHKILLEEYYQYLKKLREILEKLNTVVA